MTIWEAFEKLKLGYIVRCKHSYFILNNSCLWKVSKEGKIIGIGNLKGTMFATDDWEVMDFWYE